VIARERGEGPVRVCCERVWEGAAAPGCQSSEAVLSSARWAEGRESCSTVAGHGCSSRSPCTVRSSHGQVLPARRAFLLGQVVGGGKRAALARSSSSFRQQSFV